MVVSYTSESVYISARSTTLSTLSKWNINGTLEWGYEIGSMIVKQLVLSPDETYLILLGNLAEKIFKLDV